MSSQEFSEYQRRLLSLALLGLGDRQHKLPGLAEEVMILADKLDVRELLLTHAREWIAEANRRADSNNVGPQPPAT